MFAKNATVCFTFLLLIVTSTAQAQSNDTVTAQPSHSNIAQGNVTPTPNGTGAWSNSVAGPSMYNTNITYATADMPAPSGLSLTLKITSVYFSWAVGRSIPGLYVYLCNNYRCALIANNTSSSSASGSMTGFNGDPANSPIAFNFYVAGNGSAINPSVPGRVNSVSVNYQ